MSIRNIIDSNIIENAVSGMVIYFFGDLGFLIKSDLSFGYIGFYNGMDKSHLSS